MIRSGGGEIKNTRLGLAESENKIAMPRARLELARRFRNSGF
jgi:hypothetical protein